MMHFCRTSFPTILETKGLLSSLLLENFHPSHDLYNDLVYSDKLSAFRRYIYSFSKNNTVMVETTKTAKELMDEAGYILYDECLREEDVQSFKKYYAINEKLCTFKGRRLDDNRVFFAVKKNVSDIKREDFNFPKRQDLYGTSVLSIQFTRDSNTLSIKNRYNDIVRNPDATFSNDLENIIPGLTKAFEKDYGIVQNDMKDFSIFNYVKASDGRYYKYNYKIHNIYYCPDNIIIDNGVVKKYDNEKFIVMDYFILDIANKKISLYDDKINDSFLDLFSNIKSIFIRNVNNRKLVDICSDTRNIIVLDNHNNMFSFTNNSITILDDNFLQYNEFLKRIDMTNVIRVGDFFLMFNSDMRILNMGRVEYIGNDFLQFNEVLDNVNLHSLRLVGKNFLYFNTSLESLYVPDLRSVGIGYISNNLNIKHQFSETLLNYLRDENILLNTNDSYTRKRKY